MGVCNQIILLILYCISSRLVTILKVIGVLIEVSDILVLTVCSSSLIVSFPLFRNVCWLHVLHCLYYLHYFFGLDPVTTAF
jgi:hypothetical protein